MTDDRTPPADGEVRTRFTLQREGFWSRTFDLQREGTPIGSLELRFSGRGATAIVDGETWDLTVQGIFRQRTILTSQATGEVLAEMQGKDARIPGSAPLRWGTLSFARTWGFVRPDGSVAAQFSRLKGFSGYRTDIETATSDPRVDLLCVALGGLMLIRQAQAAAAAAAS